MGGRPEDHFSGRAGDYRTHRPVYPSRLADYLASLAPRRRLAWDCGCGSGQLSGLLGSCFRQVVATDRSREQLRHAPPSHNLQYRCEWGHASSLPEGSVDLATAAQAAHWFDLDGYYAEVRRTGRPGSVVALLAYRLMRVSASIDRVIDGFYAETLGPYWPCERRLVEQGFTSMPFPFDEILPPAFEMRESRTLASLLAYVDTWSAVRRMERNAGRQGFEGFASELGRVWGDADRPRTVRWPISCRIGRIG